MYIPKENKSLYESSRTDDLPTITLWGEDELRFIRDGNTITVPVDLLRKALTARKFALEQRYMNGDLVEYDGDEYLVARAYKHTLYLMPRHLDTTWWHYENGVKAPIDDCSLIEPADPDRDTVTNQ